MEQKGISLNKLSQQNHHDDDEDKSLKNIQKHDFDLFQSIFAKKGPYKETDFVRMTSSASLILCPIYKACSFDIKLVGWW